jgi:DNA-binding response OmpR family regulator
MAFRGRPSPLRVLVVEDESESLQLMGALLSLWGYEPKLCPDGPSGLAAAREERPDVVLLDIALPGMDGFEVARRLRAAAKGDSFLIVALTAYRSESHRKLAFECGFDQYLMKPVDLTSLRAVLERASPRSAEESGTSASALAF